ncbi:S8 family serine peptidase [Promineifilum sp.]|uniref:S8 family serine peptidase n=1 Tax=Promineifilum sp. TaxID=2664178 RepID=UPI0035B47745
MDTKRGEPGLAAALVLAMWIGGTALALYVPAWMTEQITLAGGEAWSAWNGVAIVATHALVAGLPAWLAALRARDPRYRAIFRAWALAALFALLLMPVRLAGPTEAQPAAWLQIGCVLLYLGLLWLIRRRAGAADGVDRPAPPARAGRHGWGIALAAGLGLALPWAAWGALGSPLDTLLNVAAALLFGLAAGQTLEDALLSLFAGAAGRPAAGILLGGVVIAAMLAIMGPAFGVNGQQIIFLFLLPALGWAAATLAWWSQEDGRAAGLFLGLAVAAPLLFIDPDELSIMLNLGARDVGFYAVFATLLGAAGGLLLGLLGLLLALAWPRRRAGRGAAALAALAGLGAGGLLLAVYFLFGQPGWHGERLFVILRDQADIGVAVAIADPVERRDFVYHTLAHHASATQADLRRALDAAGIDYTPYYLSNSLEVSGGPLLKWWLARRPEVERILDSPTLRPLPAPSPAALGAFDSQPDDLLWNVLAVGAPRVWDELGARGAGIIIGQADSGVDGAHPELRDTYRGNQPEEATGLTGGNDYNWLDPWNHTTAPTDRMGHGTHTLGSALGRSVGVAPDATWIGCVNLARNLGNAPRYLDCFQFLFAPFPQDGDALADGRPDLGAHVLNNSWGCPDVEGCDAAALLPAVRALRAAGVFVVASAGNDGDACSTVYAPIALYDEVFTVGATDIFDAVASFSSRGPVLADGSGRTKPDVVAPGVDIVSAYPGGTYETLEGTSMAGPHVVGVVALLWSANPALIGDIERTERLLAETAQPLEADDALCGDLYPNNAAGYGLVDAYTAVRRALEEVSSAD